MLLGRDHELAAVRTALAGVADARPSVLAFAGDDGSGRSSLLAAAVTDARSAGALVLFARGTVGDSAPPYGTLLALLRPLESRFEELVGETAAAAVRTSMALGRRAVDPLDVGLGVLRIVTSAAELHPLVLVLDDAAGVDEASRSALVFALARLGVDRVGAFLGLPPARSPWDTAVTNRIDLAPLGRDDLTTIVVTALDCGEQAAARCAEWAAGSPLLALELCRSLSPDQRDGRQSLPAMPRPTGRAVERLQQRLDQLSERARRACVVIAASRSAGISAVTAALSMLGEDDAGVADAEDAGVVALDGDRVAFTHPLLEPLAYHLVAASSRRAAHRALAAVLTEPHHAAARAWHLADAAVGPVEDVAAALELVAGDLRRRGALLDSATALARAATLSPGAAAAGRRRRAAARAHLDAFDFDGALSLVAPDDDDAEAALLAIEAIERRDGAVAALAAVAIAAVVPRDVAVALRCDLLLSSGRRSVAARELAAGRRADGSAALAALVDAVGAALDPGTPLPPEPAGDGGAIASRARRRWLSAAAQRGITVTQPSSVDELVATATAIAESDPAAACELVERARATVPPTATGTLDELGRLAERFDEAAVVTSPLPEVVATLTKAERRVAEAVAAGRTNREVADQLFVSVKTVDFHLQAIYRKLNVRSRTELAVLLATDRRAPKRVVHG